MLTELDRGEDYIELSLDGRLTWNPLSATWLDSYSLAYTVASLLNQLFGKGKEPFWQQAHTNLVRWIIELYRVLPGGWVTLRDVYHCAIDKELFANKIERSRRPSLDPTTWSDWSCALTRPLSLPSWAWGRRARAGRACPDRLRRTDLEGALHTRRPAWTRQLLAPRIIARTNGAWTAITTAGPAKGRLGTVDHGRLNEGNGRPKRPFTTHADPRTHPGLAHGRADATAAGRSRCRKLRCGWPRPRWRTATPPCPRSAVNSGS